MRKYLLSIYQPDGPPPPSVDLARIMADVHKVQDEMKAAGAWVFSDGLHPAASATVARFDGDRMMVTDGPYVEGKEHLGGLTIIQAPDLDAALEWGQKLARAIVGLPIEIRPFADHQR